MNLDIINLKTNRTCGNCTDCCTVMGVMELRKPYFQRCQHQLKGGCKIYKSKPISCSEFACFYLAKFIDQRPNELGFMVTANQIPDFGNQTSLDIYETTENLDLKMRKWSLVKAALDSHLKIISYPIMRYFPYQSQVGTQYHNRGPVDYCNHDTFFIRSRRVKKLAVLFDHRYLAGNRDSAEQIAQDNNLIYPILLNPLNLRKQILERAIYE